MKLIKSSIMLLALMSSLAWGALNKGQGEASSDLFVEDTANARAMAEELAVDYLNSTPSVLAGVDDFYTTAVHIDSLGMAHMRIQQVHEGIPVFGAQAIVHMNAQGTVRGVSEKLARYLRVNTVPSVSSSDAVAQAIIHHGNRNLKEAPEVDLFILRHAGRDSLAFRVSIKDLHNARPSMPVMFINAQSGELIWSYDNLKSARNRNTYTANNGSSLPGSLVRNEASGASGDAVVDEAHDNAGLVYDYFSIVHGRDSYNNNGATINSTVHFLSNYVNAFWNGSQMVYGDGDGTTSGPLTVTDIVAHELTHAVTEFSSNLIYANESGALNEAMSDIFGAAIEAYRDGGSSLDTYKIGEETWTPGIAGDALRYMYDPAIAGDVDYYPDRFTGTADNGGVHTNSGIANLAFYLVAEGGTHPRGKTSNNVSGIGITDAAAIFYRANTVYMTSSSNYSDARSATAGAASDLFGAASNQVTQMGEAWTAVGVVPPPNYNVIDTQSGLSGSTGNQTTFGPYDASNFTAIKFVMSGGSGDADLYVRFGAAPTTATYDCRPYLNGNNETCEFNPSSSGTYFVMIRAFSTYSNVTLTVSAAGSGPSTETNCSDGIDNDGDGDTDCADSDCSSDPACQGPATETNCSDGIDNDGDGDTDCADSDCSSDPACNTAGWQVIASTDFESGFGGYTDGGSDCRRSSRDSAFANSGTYCVRIRDNSGSASSFFTTNGFNVSSSNQLRIEYSLYTVSMEVGEDYFVEIWDGSAWQVVANYARGTDFNNNTRYSDDIVVNINNLSDLRVRFRCDASANGDRVYIDDVIISVQ